jgi:membrane-associated phospholipid phosphatase
MAVNRVTAGPRQSSDAGAHNAAVRDASTTPSRAHPLKAATRELLIGYGAMVLCLLTIGLLLTHPLDSTVGRWDLDVNQWFVTRRATAWTSVSGFLSLLLDTFPVIGVALVAVVVFCWRHRLREALTIAVGLVLEISVFLSVTFVVARPRPAVHHLSSVPVTSSFPSGHTAAAVVLYGGIVLGLCSSTRNRMVRMLLWTAVGFLVIAVGIARVYRGMHHPTDVAVGALFGATCLWFAWHAVRTYFGRDVDPTTLEATQ